MKNNIVDVILDEINKIIREECKGMNITDRTELFTGGLYNIAKERIEDVMIDYMI